MKLRQRYSCICDSDFFKVFKTITHFLNNLSSPYFTTLIITTICAQLYFQNSIAQNLPNYDVKSNLTENMGFNSDSQKSKTTTNTKHISVTLGKSLNFPMSSEVWIENKSVLLANAKQNLIQIKAISVGSSLLRLDSKVYRIFVTHPEFQNMKQNLKVAILKTTGLKLIGTDSEVLITGKLFRMKDWVEIASSVENNISKYFFKAELNEHLKKEAEQYFAKLLIAKNLHPQPLIFSDDIFMYIPEKLEIEKYDQILSPFGISVKKDQLGIQTEPVIRVQVIVTEIKKEFTRNMGLAWPNQVSGILSDGAASFVNQFPLMANLNEKYGWGKVLASPNLIARSGKEATFMAGGEFPIKIMNFKTQDVIWKKYGIMMKIKPTADLSGRISLSLETEVSSIDTSRTVDGIPAIYTNRVSSQFDLNKSKIIALSGLIKNEEGQSSEGLPFLTQLPILGNLFASEDFKESKTELVIFVKPEIYNEYAND